MSKPLTFSLIIITFILGLNVGFILSPEYAVKMQSRNTSMVELGKSDKFVDLRYIDNMIAHHQSAIFMAKQIPKCSQGIDLINLGKEIIKSDEASITELYSWKKSWYKDTRVITNYEKINLGECDSRFDLRFINAMISHHDEAIASAKEIRTKSSRNEILNLADNVIQSLSASKSQLIEWRKNWFNI